MISDKIHKNEIVFKFLTDLDFWQILAALTDLALDRPDRPDQPDQPDGCSFPDVGPKEHAKGPKRRFIRRLSLLPGLGISRT